MSDITLRISAADQVSWQIGRTLRINVRWMMTMPSPPEVFTLSFDRRNASLVCNEVTPGSVTN